MQNFGTSQRIGLLAGAGDIPVYFARRARARGVQLVSIAFSKDIDASLQPFVDRHYSIGVGQSGKIVDTLKKENVHGVLMLGKIEKSILFKPQLFDLRALKALKRLVTHEDKSVLSGVIVELQKEGFTVLSQMEFLKELFPEPGVLTHRKPSRKEDEDIRFALPIAKKLADMEIGQTLLVRNKTVIAAEAVEGTDQAIQRGCSLAKGKCVAVKVSRTNQDYRYDTPGIGEKTVELLVQGGASVLAVEAGRVMIADLPQVVKRADEGGLSLVAV
ncbi:MAG: LpxI family protein [Nitrospinales bacterium]